MASRATSAFGVALTIVVASCSSDYGDAKPSTPTSDGGIDAPNSADDAGASDDGASGADSADASGPGCPACVVLAEQQDMPTELLLVGMQLFWVNVGSNISVPKLLHLDTKVIETADTYGPDMHDLVWLAPCPWAIDKTLELNRLFPSNACDAIVDAKRLTTFDTDFIWTNGDSLRRGNCGGTNFTLIGNKTDLQAVLGDTSRVWFSDATGTIASCDPSGSGQCAGSIAQLATGQGAVTLLAADEARVYWSSPGTPSTIRARMKTQGAPPAFDIATGQGAPKAIVPRGGDVYWTDADRGTVMKGSATGGTVTALASGLERPWGLAVGPTDVFVAESARGRILRIPR